MGCDDRFDTATEKAQRKRQDEAERLLAGIQCWQSDRLDLGELLFLVSKTRAFAPDRLFPVADFCDEDLQHLRKIFKRHHNMDD